MGYGPICNENPGHSDAVVHGPHSAHLVSEALLELQTHLTRLPRHHDLCQPLPLLQHLAHNCWLNWWGWGTRKGWPVPPASILQAAPCHFRETFTMWSLVYPSYLFIYIFFGRTTQHVGSWFPDQGSNPCPVQWKCRVLTTGPPGKSPSEA